MNHSLKACVCSQDARAGKGESAGCRSPESRAYLLEGYPYPYIHFVDLYTPGWPGNGSKQYLFSPKSHNERR